MKDLLNTLLYGVALWFSAMGVLAIVIGLLFVTFQPDWLSYLPGEYWLGSALGVTLLAIGMAHRERDL